MSVRIGLVGDFNPDAPAHRAIPAALSMAGDVESIWIPTEQVTNACSLLDFDGIWCVPASPYRSMAGALLAIRFARESRVPHLGSCGGFQHAIIEYARNALGWEDADHAETSPAAARPVISLLSCPLVEKTAAIHLRPGTLIAAAYGETQTTEAYHCRYGLNPAFRAALETGPMRVSAEDDAGEVRAIELSTDAHPFFVATLFQSERRALEGRLPPIVAAFVAAATAQAV